VNYPGLGIISLPLLWPRQYFLKLGFGGVLSFEVKEIKAATFKPGSIVFN